MCVADQLLFYLSQREHYLGRTAGWIHQVLARHLDGLVGAGKLDGIHEALLTSLAVGVRDAHQVGGLGNKQEGGASANGSEEETPWHFNTFRRQSRSPGAPKGRGNAKRDFGQPICRVSPGLDPTYFMTAWEGAFKVPASTIFKQGWHLLPNCEPGNVN